MSDNFKGLSLKKMEFCTARGTAINNFSDEIMEAFLSEPFFTRRRKMLSRPDDLMLYGKLAIDFFSTSELLHPNKKNRL